MVTPAYGECEMSEDTEKRNEEARERIRLLAEQERKRQKITNPETGIDTGPVEVNRGGSQHSAS